MPNRRPVRLLRENEARSFVDGVADPKTKRLVELAYEPLLRRFKNAEQFPIADFDALFSLRGCSGR
jgi:hypothetical protein